jgi:hypothetical protein
MTLVVTVGVVVVLLLIMELLVEVPLKEIQVGEQVMDMREVLALIILVRVEAELAEWVIMVRGVIPQLMVVLVGVTP